MAPSAPAITACAGALSTPACCSPGPTIRSASWAATRPPIRWSKSKSTRCGATANRSTPGRRKPCSSKRRPPIRSSFRPIMRPRSCGTTASSIPSTPATRSAWRSPPRSTRRSASPATACSGSRELVQKKKRGAEEIIMERMRERNLIQRVNVGDMLTRSAARAPGDTAIVDGARRFSYGEFNALANRTAQALTALGCVRGEALALMSTNNAEFLAVYYACAKLGVICVPINLFWRHRELGYVLSHARAKYAVVEDVLIEQLQTGLGDAPAISDIVVIGAAASADIGGRRTHGFAALVGAAPAHEPEVIVEDRDPISYLYTSGTTSAPKGVVSSHLAVYIESLGVALDTRLTARDRMAALMPLFHTAQLNAFVTPAI